jgi:hypothetical protein
MSIGLDYLVRDRWCCKAGVFEDSRNCHVSSDKALIALEGVDDLVAAPNIPSSRVTNQIRKLGSKYDRADPIVAIQQGRLHKGRQINRSAAICPP